VPKQNRKIATELIAVKLFPLLFLNFITDDPKLVSKLHHPVFTVAVPGLCTGWLPFTHSRNSLFRTHKNVLRGRGTFKRYFSFSETYFL